MKISRFVFPSRTRHAVGIAFALGIVLCMPILTGCGGEGPGFSTPATKIGRLASPDNSVTLIFLGAAGSNPTSISYQRTDGKPQSLFGLERGAYSVEARRSFAFWTPTQNKAYYMGTVYNEATKHFETKLYLVDFDAMYPQFEGKVAHIFPYTDLNLEAYDRSINLDTIFYPTGISEDGKRLRYAKEVATGQGFTMTNYEFDTEQRTSIELK